MREGFMDDDQLDIMLSKSVGAVAKFKGGFDPKDSLLFINPPNQNQTLYMDAEAVRRNAREIIGFSRNQFGEFEEKGRKTATEVMSVQQGSNLRMSRRGRKVAGAYEEILKKVNPIICKYWTTPRWVEVVGPSGAQTWMQYNGPQLVGDHGVDVFFSPIAVPTLTARQQRGITLYQQLQGLRDPSVLNEFLQGAMNDPELSGVLKSADLRVQLQQMQQKAGAGAPSGGAGQGSQVSGV
jgi:hypothetical protein